MKLNAKWAKTRAQALGRELSENISESKRNGLATKSTADSMNAFRRKNNSRFGLFAKAAKLPENISGPKRNGLATKSAADSMNASRLFENISGSKRNELATKSTAAAISAIKANRGKFSKVGKLK